MTNKNTITLTLTDAQIQKLEQTFSSDKQAKIPPYARYQLKLENCVITAYTSNKVVFQGKDASIYASPFQERRQIILPQAGSDEVGTGDYFGPVCVCASYVSEENIKLVESLHARDSKALKDSDIRQIAPKLIQHVIHSTLIVLPAKYNIVHQTNNMNAIKAKLHNQAYINLSKKIDLPAFKIIDQFAPESLYYRYLNHEQTVIRNIHFETKAEDKYVSVAVSSIIARYAFLDTLDKMEKEYDMPFQKGGGTLADECARTFIKRYGKERLSQVAKLHFKNTERL